jgi:TolB-like protein/DNA-binding winged helix-turn-helix (wHTH) protein
MGTIQESRGAVRFDVFEVDLHAGELRKQGVKIKLQEQPFQILQMLLEHPGEVVTREELQKRIWPADTFVDFEQGLYNAIKRLREALGDSPETPRYVETLPRRGYRFIGLINGVVSASAAKEALGASLARPSSMLLRSPVMGALGALILAATVFALNLGGIRQRLLLKKNSPAVHSLAVLPLTSLSSDPNQEYFAEGMTDALITDLSQIGALRVVSRTSVMRYNKTDKSAPQIARELNVDAIIEGTVQRSGDRVRVTAQLIYGPEDQHLWADSYERDMQDAFALQGVVARAIADEIRVKMTPKEQERLQSVRPVNPKALEAYLSGRFHLEQYGKLELYRGKEEVRSEELRKALAYFDQATALDPQYIPPYLSFFDAMNSLVPQLDLIPRVEAGVATALQLDESNVRAHLARAQLLEQYEYDWPGAEKEIKRAIEINPNSAEAHFQYAEYFGMRRQEDEKKERELAQALDPSHDYFADAGTTRIGWTLEQHKQAVEERAPDDPLSRGVLGKDYAIAGRFDESAEEYEKCLRLYGYTEFADMIHSSRTKAGGKAALRDWMRAAEKEYLRGAQLASFAFAFTYASLGDRDNAFRWLEKAYQERNWCILYLKADPVWEPIRSDPRFANLLRRVGLPQ